MKVSEEDVDESTDREVSTDAFIEPDTNADRDVVAHREVLALALMDDVTECERIFVALSRADLEAVDSWDEVAEPVG